MMGWKAENFIFQSGVDYESAGSGFVWFGHFTPEEFKQAGYGNLFAYMYRRFGIPQHGSDDHKEIAKWYITTPDPGVGLRVSPVPSGGGFGYVIATGIYDDRRNEEQIKAVQKALTAAMLDLLVPVYVRDVPINAIGRVDDCDHDSAYGEWKWAGYGVPTKYFEEIFGERGE